MTEKLNAPLGSDVVAVCVKRQRRMQTKQNCKEKIAKKEKEEMRTTKRMKEGEGKGKARAQKTKSKEECESEDDHKEKIASNEYKEKWSNAAG